MTTDVKERKAPTPTCTDHCATCGRHFHGLGAFDAHLDQGVCCDPSEVTKTARDGTTRPALQIWTERGACRLGRGCYKNGVLVQINSPVTVWQVYQTEAQQMSLSALREAR